MHYWGDKGVDWEGIDAAAVFIGRYCRRWGRLGGDSKEKYGTVRFYAAFGYLSLHTLFYPGYVRYMFPKWLVHFDLYFVSPVLEKIFQRPFVAWQKFIYNRAYQKALKKWPHLRAEILCGADWPTLIKGATRIDGTKTHVLGWHGEILSTWISSGN